jgi:hypothetical protein
LLYKPSQEIMKRVFLLALFTAGFLSSVFSQETLRYEKPLVLLNAEKGYIMINEITSGFGLGVTDAPFAKYYFGFTTTHGYQINKDFIAGGGTGISFYNGGTLVPLFLDFRYRIYVSRVTPYVVADGGFMLDFSGKKDTRPFINPGAGFTYTLKPKLALNFGAGLFVQWGSFARDSYINLRTGVTYKF